MNFALSSAFVLVLSLLTLSCATYLKVSYKHLRRDSDSATCRLVKKDFVSGTEVYFRYECVDFTHKEHDMIVNGESRKYVYTGGRCGGRDWHTRLTRGHAPRGAPAPLYDKPIVDLGSTTVAEHEMCLSDQELIELIGKLPPQKEADDPQSKTEPGRAKKRQADAYNTDQNY